MRGGQCFYVGGYRYGFNGMERDDKVKGSGNSYLTEFRQYDPRVGRWLSLDPMANKFPWQSPYVAFDNNPIYYNDPRGLAAEGGGDEEGLVKKGDTFIGDDGKEYTATAGDTEVRSPEGALEALRKPGILKRAWNSFKNDTKIVRDYRIVNYVLKKAVEYLNSLFPPGKYSPYEDRNKNPYETNGGLHETSEEGQGAENHTVKYDPEKKNEPETINIDVVVPGAEAIREAWNKLIQYNNKRKVSTSKEVEDKVKESNSEKMGGVSDSGGSKSYSARDTVWRTENEQWWLYKKDTIIWDIEDGKTRTPRERTYHNYE